MKWIRTVGVCYDPAAMKKCSECGRRATYEIVDGRCANVASCNRRRVQAGLPPAPPPPLAPSERRRMKCDCCGRRAHPGIGCWERSRQLKQARADAEAERLRKGRARQKHHVLYRFFNDRNELLYVGITNDIVRRFNDHSEGKSWWGDVVLARMEHFPDRASLQIAERRAIQTEFPSYNIVHAA